MTELFFAELYISKRSYCDHHGAVVGGVGGLIWALAIAHVRRGVEAAGTGPVGVVGPSGCHDGGGHFLDRRSRHGLIRSTALGIIVAGAGGRGLVVSGAGDRRCGGNPRGGRGSATRCGLDGFASQIVPVSRLIHRDLIASVSITDGSIMMIKLVALLAFRGVGKEILEDRNITQKRHAAECAACRP